MDEFVKEKNEEYKEQRRGVYKEIASLIDGHIYKEYQNEDLDEATRKLMRFWYTPDMKPNLRWATLYYLYRYYTFYGNTSYAPGRKHVIYNILDLVNTQRYYNNVVSISRLYYKKFTEKELFNPKAVIMLDPPYMDETRVEQGAYKTWEFTEKQHRYFLEHISQPGIKAKILVCGYSTSFYDRRLTKYNAEKGCTWQKVRILKAGKKERGAREVLWVNFDFKPIIDKYPDEFAFAEWDFSYRKRKKSSNKDTTKE